MGKKTKVLGHTDRLRQGKRLAKDIEKEQPVR